MNNQFRRWACGLLALVCVLLAACGAFVWAVDPCFYYRLPADGTGVFFNERYQNAGLARNTPADTVLLGTSMVANYRPGQVAEAFGGTAVKLTMPDGYVSEFTTVVEAALRWQTPRRVVFGLDVNILTRDESGVTGALPEYLYNANPLDDVKYLLNRDTLYYSVYTLLQRSRGQTQPLEQAFTWEEDLWWNHMTALANYERPEIAETPLAADAYGANTDANLTQIEGWLTAHPDTEFDIFLSPYSLLYWDKTLRLGECEAVFAALEEACRRLTAYDNCRLYGLLMDRDIVENLDYYADYIHHSDEAAAVALQKIAAGESLLTEENWAETLANWREFVVNYPYDQYWTDAFWWQWDIAHGAPVVWQPGDGD